MSHGNSNMNSQHSIASRMILHTVHGKFFCDPIIGYFDVLTHGRLPFAQFTIKVVQKEAGRLQATPNVMVYNSSTKCIEHVCGFGLDVETAVVDCVNMLLSEAVKQEGNKNSDLDENDFVWLNWQPYVQLSMPPTS